MPFPYQYAFGRVKDAELELVVFFGIGRDPVLFTARVGIRKGQSAIFQDGQEINRKQAI